MQGENSPPFRRVLVIGLDGGTFGVIRPLAEKGALPNLSRMMAQGSCAVLESTIPSFTAPAWCSFITGTNPGKHGVFDFVKDYGLGFTCASYGSRDLREKTVFRLLSDAGKRVLALDIPMTYPPEEVNGALVTGLMTPGDACEFTCPKELKRELSERFGTFTFDVEAPDTESGDYSQAIAVKRQILGMVAQRFAIMGHLMATREWDFGMAVVTGTDRVQHFFWKYFDATHPRHDASAPPELKGAVEDVFRSVDDGIGALVSQAGPDALTLIVSDHGHGPLYKIFHMNRWLSRNGFLARGKKLVSSAAGGGWEPESGGNAKAEKAGGGFRLSLSGADSFAGAKARLAGLEDDAVYSVSCRIRADTPRMLVEFCNLGSSRQPFLREFFARGGEETLRFKMMARTPCMDFSVRVSSYGGHPLGTLELLGAEIAKLGNYGRMRAFARAGEHGVRINLRGRDPYGSVPESEFARLKEEIFARLSAEKDASTGKPLFRRVMRGEEAYWGDAAKDGPDVVFDDFAHPHAGMENPSLALPATTQTGSHRQEGIFIAFGPGVQKAELGALKIWDAAPTVLCALGVPIPDGMDGRPVLAVLGPGAEPRYSSGGGGVAPAGGAAESESELALVDSRLRALGYLE
jgi:predicted AlkP superfamily phosphohydrolase/phosphomutase